MLLMVFDFNKNIMFHFIRLQFPFRCRDLWPFYTELPLVYLHITNIMRNSFFFF